MVSGAAPGADGPIPWRAAGKLAADLDGAALTNAAYRFGPEERALRAEGSASLVFGAPVRLVIDAAAKQANLDSLLRRKGEDAVPPARAVALFSAALSPAFSAAGPARLEARLAVGDAILGGDTLGGLTAAVETKPGDPTRIRLDVSLPGTSRLKVDGTAEIGAAPRFDGAVDFSTGDVGLIGRWAGQGAPDFAAWADALGDAVPGSRFAASGSVGASAQGFAAKPIRIALGPSVLSGALAVARPVGAGPGRIDADLAADSLAIDALPTLGSARSLIGGYDLALSLEAKALRVAHLGDDGVDGASLDLKLGKTGPRYALDRLAVAGLGGASLEAAGALGPDGVAARGRLSAGKLSDFAALVSRLAPGPWSRALVERASLLSPASVAFEAEGQPASDGAPALRSLKANGTAAATRVGLDLEPAGKSGGQAIALNLDSPDAAALVRQIGLVGSASQGGAAHAEMRASGAWAAGYAVDASASLGGAALAWRGRYAPTAEGDEAGLFGSLKLEGGNVAPLAALFGVAPRAGTIGPVAAEADVTRRGDSWNVSRISATVAGLKTTGALVYAPPPERAQALAAPDLSRAEEAVGGPAADTEPPLAAISGQLTFDRLRLADLLALSLGPPQPPRPGANWSTARFAAPPLTPPSAAVRLNAGTIGLTDGLVAQGFSTSLRLDGGRLDLDDVAMKVGGDAVSGRVTLRRSGDMATLEGAVSAEPMLLKRKGFAGRVGGRFDFASTGKSPAALIAGLAGGGEVELSGAALPQSDPAALDRVVAAAQADGAEIDETNVAYAFGAALNKGALAIPGGPAPLSLSAGTIRLGPLAFEAGQVQASLTAGFDLSRSRPRNPAGADRARGGTQVLDGAAAVGERHGRERARRSDATDRGRGALGRTRDAGDRARVGPHRQSRGRHP